MILELTNGYFILLLVYIASNYLFKRMRTFLAFQTMLLGVFFIINDWQPTLIPDDTLKLTFLLSFVIYSLFVLRNIQISEA